jgi:uncharacterized membrane protein YidH (DUF202 family)
MSELCDKVLDKIQEEKIEQKPKQLFLLEEFFNWAIIVCLVIVTGLFVGILIENIVNLDWDLYYYFNSNIVEYAISNIPVFLIIFALLMIALAYTDFKNTGTNYRFTKLNTIILFLTLSAIAGTVFFALGISRITDRVLADSLPVYRSIRPNPIYQWQQPDKGFLIGEVIEIQGDLIVLKDMQNKNWIVRLNNNLANECERGQIIKLVGTPGSDSFEAKELRITVRDNIIRYFEL